MTRWIGTVKVQLFLPRPPHEVRDILHQLGNGCTPIGSVLVDRERKKMDMGVSVTESMSRNVAVSTPKASCGVISAVDHLFFDAEAASPTQRFSSSFSNRYIIYIQIDF